MASSTTELSRRLAQVRTSYPDGRTRQHKQAVKHVYESTICDLKEMLSEEIARNKQLQSSVALGNYDNEDTPSCSICMDDMCGRVTLMCGHEMCPECFAQHSRVNNTCPFCREEFAPKPKKQSSMPLYMLDDIIETWVDSISPGYVGRHWIGERPTSPGNYFTRQRILNHSKRPLEADEHLEWLVTANCKILMEKVKNWYDNDIP